MSFPSTLTLSPLRFYVADSTDTALVLTSKSSADVLDYTVDFTTALQGTSDTVQSAVLLAPNRRNVSYPLTSIGSAINGKLVSLILASGQPGDIVPFAIEVTTLQGRTIVQPLQITITSYTPATMPPAEGSTVTVGGVSVTVSGAPITITAGPGKIAAASLTTLEAENWIAVSRNVNGTQTLYRVDGGALGLVTAAQPDVQGPKGDTGPQGESGPTEDGPYLPLPPVAGSSLPAINGDVSVRGKVSTSDDIAEARDAYLQGPFDSGTINPAWLNYNTETGVIQVGSSLATSSDVGVGGNLEMTGSIFARTVREGANGQILFADRTIVTNAGSGILVLPVPQTGREMVVMNRSGVTIAITPADSSTSIESAAPGSNVLIAANSTSIFYATSPTQWYRQVTLNDSGMSVPVGAVSINPSTWRPNYHISPPNNTMNDIQRPLRVNGRWYGWYLYNRSAFNATNTNGTEWRQINTTNFAQWSQSNLTSIPKYTTPYGDIWTGSSVVDVNNTAGFGAGAIVAIVTMSGNNVYDTGRKDSNGNEIYLQGQSNFLWYTNDITQPMTFYGLVAINPGLTENGTEANFRDPSVFWDGDRNRWALAEAEGSRIKFYISPDLKNWTYAGMSQGHQIASVGTLECPNLVKMTVGTTTKWVLFFGCNINGTCTGYQIGDFDGANFTPNQDKFINVVDSGPDFYGAAVWQDENGNTFIQGWMDNWDYAWLWPTKPAYVGSMSLTRQLNLTDSLDYILCSPVASQNEVFYRSVIGAAATISDNTPYATPISASQSYRIDLVLAVPAGGSWPKTITLIVEQNATHQTTITFTPASSIVSVDRSASGTQVANSSHWTNAAVATLEFGTSVEISLFVDNSTLELFSADRKTMISAVFFPVYGATARGLTCSGGSVLVSKFNVLEM